MSHTKRRPERAFTIVELLAVIGAIAVLLGILLVGLQSGSRMSRNVKSMSRLKQLHIAWTAYSNAYQDQLLPGYLEPGVQENWRVRYKTADGTRVSPGQSATYPWRLLPYLDFDMDTLYGYRNDVDELAVSASQSNDPNFENSVNVMSAVPAFGYNAYYVGGWWEDREGINHLVYGNSAANILVGDDVRTVKGRLVATSLARITDPSRVVAFCSSIYRSPGATIRDQSGNPDGAAWVVPKRLCQTEIWRLFSGDSLRGISASLVAPFAGAGEGIEVFVEQAVPFERHGISIPSMNCDGSVVQSTLDDLANMDRWMSVASSGEGSPSSFSHQCDDETEP